MPSAKYTSQKNPTTESFRSLTGPRGHSYADGITSTDNRRPFLSISDKAPRRGRSSACLSGPGKDTGPAHIFEPGKASMRAACVVGGQLHVFYDNNQAMSMVKLPILT